MRFAAAFWGEAFVAAVFLAAVFLAAVFFAVFRGDACVDVVGADAVSSVTEGISPVAAKDS